MLVSTNVFNTLSVYAVVIALASSLIMRVMGEFGLFGIGQANVFSVLMCDAQYIVRVLSIGLIAIAPLWIEKCIIVCKLRARGTRLGTG